MTDPVTSVFEVRIQNRISTDRQDWRAAITLWLDTRRSVETRRAYARALEDLLATSGALIWEVTRTDVMRWVKGMEKRGYAATTITQRLAGASSFFRFVMEDYIVRATDGRQVPLYDHNPAAGKSLRPTVEMYGKAAWLSPEEARAFLRAIPRTTLVGQRNFALLLGYILLGRRNSEWRTARWQDFERYGQTVYLRWGGKGKTDQRLEVPLPVWNAVCEFLRAAGRLEHMLPEAPIFPPLVRVGRKTPTGQGIIDPNQPISSHEVARIVKRVCRLAGLEGKHITPHSLRHTGAMLRKEAGASDQEIMSFLGHANLAITQVYLHALEGKTDSHWARVSDILGLF
jgi:integrase